MDEKKFKDPIYGYIRIDEQLVTGIVDTPEFQRLRDVVQTSYSPLYASALHNRYVHSLGVYNLGKIAANALENSIVKHNYLDIFPDLKSYIYTFCLACLLHDVGHAPFSHTGEKYYLKSGDRTDLHKRLVAL